MFRSLKRKAIAAGGICFLAAAGLQAAPPYGQWTLGQGTTTGSSFWWTTEYTVDLSTVSPAGHLAYYVISPEPANPDPLKRDLKAWLFWPETRSTVGHCFELETVSDGNVNADTRFWVVWWDDANGREQYKSLDNNSGAGNLSKARLYIKGGRVFDPNILVSAANTNHNTAHFKFRFKRIDGNPGREADCTTLQSLPWMKIITDQQDGGYPTFSANAN